MASTDAAAFVAGSSVVAHINSASFTRLLRDGATVTKVRFCAIALIKSALKISDWVWVGLSFDCMMVFLDVLRGVVAKFGAQCR